MSSLLARAGDRWRKRGAVLHDAFDPSEERDEHGRWAGYGRFSLVVHRGGGTPPTSDRLRSNQALFAHTDENTAAQYGHVQTFHVDPSNYLDARTASGAKEWHEINHNEDEAGRRGYAGVIYPDPHDWKTTGHEVAILNSDSTLLPGERAWVDRERQRGRDPFTVDMGTRDALLQPSRRDPTGTGPLRGRFRDDLDRRWARLRVLATEAIDKANILGLGAPTVSTIAQFAKPLSAQHAPLPGVDKVRGFSLWLDEAMRQVVVGNDGAWTAKYINDAALLAKKRAAHLVGSKLDADVDSGGRLGVLRSVTVSELQGICEAVSQQAVRAVAEGLMLRQRPAKIARAVAERIDAIGKARGRQFVQHMVVKTFSAATLDAFRAAGIQKVGTAPERALGSSRQTAYGKTLDASPDDEPRDEHGRWASGGATRSNGTVVAIHGIPENINKISKHLAKLPQSHIDKFAGSISVSSSGDLGEHEHGIKVAKHDPDSGSITVTDPNDEQVLLHEMGHAYDRFKNKGDLLSPGDQVGREIRSDAATMTAKEAIKAKYWENNKERFAEAYSLAYSSPDPKNTFFGMKRQRASVVFKKSIDLIRSKFGTSITDASVGWRATASPKASSIFQRRPTKPVGRVSYGSISRTKGPSLKQYRSIVRGERALQGLGEVDVLTAGDDDVCPICEDISDNGPYDIDEAESLIPAHVSCRCAFVPAADERFAEVDDE